jgi:hypothetical protein
MIKFNVAVRDSLLSDPINFLNNAALCIGSSV